MERFLALAASIKVGDPKDPATEMGPLTSPTHRDRVLSYVQVAVDEGGEVLLGGKAPDDPALANGCYIEPTIVRAKHTDRVCQEEVFGPFVTITTFRTDEEALEIANSTDYGLGSGLWTTNLQRAHRIAAEMRAGMVWVNCYEEGDMTMPFGGVKASGFGRDKSLHALEKFTDIKATWIDLSE